MKFFVLFLTFSITISAYTQSCITKFNNQIKSIVKTSDGSIVYNSDNFKITKVDSNFDTIWHNDNLNFTSNSLNTLNPTFDDGFIGAGGNLTPYLYKFDSVGDTLWKKECDLIYPGLNYVNLSDIIQTSDSGFFFTASYGLMGLATLVGKTDVLGNTLWVKTNILYSSSATQFRNRVKTITETNNGDLIVSGTINESSGNNPPEDYSYIFKYNTLGDSLWAKTYEDLSFSSLKIDANQNFIIASQSGINSGSSSSKILKTNPLGDTLWTKNVSGDVLNAVEVTLEGDYLFGGSKYFSLDQCYLLKTDLNGATIWSKEYESDSLGAEIKKVIPFNNEYLLLGSDISSSPFYSPYLDNRISVDTAGYCLNSNNTSIVSDNLEMISIYPNPTRDQIKITGYKNFEKIEMYDLLGAKLAVFKRESISLFYYPKGVYLLNVFCDDQFKQFKIIKN